MPCKTSEDQEIIVPESYDWREDHSVCVQPPPVVTRNCTSTYVQMVMSVVQDKICQDDDSGPVKLSTQEVLDCDKASNGCQGGHCNRAINWGRKRGFLPEECYPNTGLPGECPDDHLIENTCRQTNNFYRVIDFCIATDVDGIKKEILKNGPALGQLTPNTDFLTYKEGIYSKTQESFRFQGQHIVKVVGWETLPDDSMAWIVENSWGEDWGDGGYARVASGNGETTLDFYALSLSVYPKTMAEYYKSEFASQETVDLLSDNLSETIMEGLEEFDPEFIEDIDLDAFEQEFVIGDDL